MWRQNNNFLYHLEILFIGFKEFSQLNALYITIIYVIRILFCVPLGVDLEHLLPLIEVCLWVIYQIHKGFNWIGGGGVSVMKTSLRHHVQSLK